MNDVKKSKKEGGIMIQDVCRDVRDTSLMVYFDSQLGLDRKSRQQLILAFFRLNDRPIGWTDREVAQYLGFADPNNVRPRRNELYKQGLIKEVMKRKCDISKRTSIAFRHYLGGN